MANGGLCKVWRQRQKKHKGSVRVAHCLLVQSEFDPGTLLLLKTLMHSYSLWFWETSPLAYYTTGDYKSD